MAQEGKYILQTGGKVCDKLEIQNKMLQISVNNE